MIATPHQACSGNRVWWQFFFGLVFLRACFGMTNTAKTTRARKQKQARAKAKAQRAASRAARPKRVPALPREGTLQHEGEILAASAAFPSADHARKFIRELGVRKKTAAAYLACAKRLDVIARKMGFPEGMRCADAFIIYIACRMKSGHTGGVSTLTYQRSALEFRELCETREPWPDDKEIRDLIKNHNFHGKLTRSARGERMRGALTADLLAAMMDHMDNVLVSIVWIQYWACLRPHEVLGLTIDCLVEGGERILLHTNKKFRSSNAAKTPPTQRKLLCEEARPLIAGLVEEERRGRPNDTHLFSMTASAYRAKLATAITKAKLGLPSQLIFVPHSIRHGRCVDMRMHNEQEGIGILTRDQLDQAGMSRETSTRYCRTNAERIIIATPGEDNDDSSSSDDDASDVLEARRARRKKAPPRPEEDKDDDDDAAAEAVEGVEGDAQAEG